MRFHHWLIVLFQRIHKDFINKILRHPYYSLQKLMYTITWQRVYWELTMLIIVFMKASIKLLKGASSISPWGGASSRERSTTIFVDILKVIFYRQSWLNSKWKLIFLLKALYIEPLPISLLWQSLRKGTQKRYSHPSERLDDWWNEGIR